MSALLVPLCYDCAVCKLIRLSATQATFDLPSWYKSKSNLVKSSFDLLCTLIVIKVNNCQFFRLFLFCFFIDLGSRHIILLLNGMEFIHWSIDHKINPLRNYREIQYHAVWISCCVNLIVPNQIVAWDSFNTSYLIST